MAKSVARVLEEGFELIRKNYIKFLLMYLLILLFFVIITIVAAIIIFALGVSSGPASPNGTFVAAFIFFLVVLMGVVFLIEPIWLGTYYSMALQGLKGDISLTYALNQAVQKYIPLLWTFALEALIFVVIDALIFSPLVIPALGLIHAYSVTGSASSTAVTAAIASLLGIGLLLVLVYLIVSAILAPILYEAVPLVMLEGVSGIKAIRESIDMGEKNFWSILFLIVGIALIYFGINIVLSVLVDAVTILNQIAGSLLNIAITILLGAFIGAWVNALPIIFYKDYLSSKSKKG